MADVIQFSCPACDATLRLPLALAGQQGPCPCCDQELVAPDPENDLQAKVCPPPPSEPTEIFSPFAEPPLSAPIEPAAAIPAPPAAAFPAQPSNSSSRAVLVLSILLSSVLSLAIGYIMGSRSNWIISRTPLVPFQTPNIEPPVSAPLATPELSPPELVPTPPEPVALPKTAKASDSAEAALKAFLEAPDWATRSTYALNPDVTRPAMEAYSHDFPDDPTAYLSIAITDSQTDPDTGYTRFFYDITTTRHPSGFPVAVAETPTGWLVDWQKFVEFRDDHFQTFSEGPVDKNGRFHLFVRTPPEPRATRTENEHFASFLIYPPLPDREKIAYVRKDSRIYGTLRAATADGILFTPVLDVAKRSTPDGKSFLEITAIHATHWRPDEG